MVTWVMVDYNYVVLQHLVFVCEKSKNVIRIHGKWHARYTIHGYVIK